MGALVVGLLVLLPLIELTLAIVVAQWIGWDVTLLSLLALSLLGVVVVRGTIAAARMMADPTAPNQARIGPGAQAVDASLRLLAGGLLIAPGYLTALVGLALLLPLVRSVTRRAMGTAVLRKFPVLQEVINNSRIVTRRSTVMRGEVVPGEVIDRNPSKQEPDDPPA